MEYLIRAGIVIIFALSPALQANEKPHSFGLEIHNGTIDAARTGATTQLNDTDSTHYMLRYDFNFTKEFSLGLGYLDGDSSNFNSFFNLFTDSRLEYDALLVNAKYQFILSKRNRLFIQASAIQYNYDIIDDNAVVSSDEDSDFGLAIGWAMKFNKGLGLGVGYNYLRMGSDIKVKTINFGINYSF